MKYIYTTIIIIFAFTASMAQWNLFYEKDPVNKLALKNNQLFAGGGNVQLYQQVAADSFEMTQLEQYGFIGAIQFLNTNIGYVGGGCYFTFDECPGNTVYKTEDGGQTWSRTGNLNPNNNLGFGIVIDLEVLDEQRVLALTEYYGLHYSKDGGQSWEIVLEDNAANNFERLQFVDDRVGFAVARGFLPDDGNFSLIYKTEDGGENWTPVFNSQNQFKIESSYFLNETTFFITTNTGKFLKTIDGGVSWVEHPYSSDVYEIGRNLTFVTPQVGYLFTYHNTNYNSILYKTIDGGQTWFIDFQIEEYIADFIFSDPNNGYLIAGSNKIYQRSESFISLENELDLILFPNPSVDYFSIQSQNIPIESHQVNVVNATGQLVYSTQQIFKPVGVQHWSAGIYFVELRDKAGQLLRRGKFVKQL